MARTLDTTIESNVMAENIFRLPSIDKLKEGEFIAVYGTRKLNDERDAERVCNKLFKKYGQGVAVKLDCKDGKHIFYVKLPESSPFD